MRAWDEQSRRLTLDFVVHGDTGIAGPWAASVDVGEVLVFEGPGGGYAPDPTADWHLLVGDESAVPAIAAAMLAVPPGSPMVVRIVCDDADHGPTPDAGQPGSVVAASPWGRDPS